MDLNKYTLFLDVADTKNFTRSGERMGYTQPGVSHILKSLEKELGFPLFIRTKQGVELTPNAEAILPLVRQLLSVNEKLNQTVNSLNGLEEGHITIASFASISRNWLPPILYSFKQEYPGIEIELLEGGADEIVEWVENSKADFGLFSKESSSALNWIKLRDDPLMAILPSDYKIGKRNSIPVEEIIKQPFIMYVEGVDYDIQHLFNELQITPDVNYSSKDDTTIISMVSNNLGLSILPKLIVEGSKYPCIALPLEPACKRELGIGIRSESSLTPAAKKFIDYIIAKLPSETDDSSTK